MGPSQTLWGLLIAGTAVGVLCFVFVVRHRRNAAGAWLAVALLASVQWSVAYLFELGADTVEQRVWWGAFKYVGIAALPPAWLLFSLRYTGRLRQVRTWQLAVLAVEPALVWGLLAVPGTRELIRSYSSPDQTVADSDTVLFWAHTVYAYLMVAVATALLVVTLVRLSRVYRRTSVLLIASVVPPYVANAWYNLSGTDAGIDYTPFLFTLTALVLIGGLFRSRLPHLRPLARGQVFDTLPEAVFVLDPLDRVTDANPAAQHLLGHDLGAMSGRSLDDLDTPFGDAVAGLRRAGTGSELVPFAGHVYELSLSPILDRGGRDLVGRLVLVRDVSDRHALQERLAWQAMHDPLTRLANRRLLLEHIDTALARAKRQGSDVALLYLDLDDFKDVNDTLGHAAGDALLVEVAQRIDLTVRGADTTARLGGDEFAVLLDGTTTEGGAVAAAEHVLSSFREPVRLEDGVASPGVSIGIAVGCPDDAEALIRGADTALYEAKHAGGGRLSVQHLGPGDRLGR